MCRSTMPLDETSSILSDSVLLETVRSILMMVGAVQVIYVLFGNHSNVMFYR